jgi:secreted PhoX family phosphatase
MSLHDDDPTSNPSQNPHFNEVLEINLKRRQLLAGGLGAAMIGFFGVPGLSALSGVREAGASAIPPRYDFGGIGFDGIAPNNRELDPNLIDDVRLPPGYRYQVLYRWGDPIGAVGQRPGEPAWKDDASNDSIDQTLQSGDHHDGMHYFPGPGNQGSRRGVLCVNHEYNDQSILFPDGTDNWSLEKVRKSQHAHGVSVVEVWRKPRSTQWEVKRPSPFARRIHGNTPMLLTGPAAGDGLLKTTADPTGTLVLGTLNNCAHGYTPWGTYLTCEENWNGYFSNESGDVTGVPDADQKLEILAGQTRYGIVKGGFGYRWHEFDERFRADLNPNEPNRFGYIVEIDPMDPRSMPKKRTALGRVKHENAEHVVAASGQVVVYTGDDERNEYIYKFVTAGRYKPNNRRANMDLLDEGILYVAKFNDDGSGEWIPLTPNHLALANWTQAEICIRTRQAADAVGATMMDRPEWIAANPKAPAHVYCTLTNNSNRGRTPESSHTPDGLNNAGAARPPVDAANPRGGDGSPTGNAYGHIIRWHEDGDDSTSTTFTWDIFVLAGDPAQSEERLQGNIIGDLFNSPDGLWFDGAGRLWIQTDASTSGSSYDPGGVNENIGTNQMLCADPESREIRRFLTGPRGCEVTGVVTTPDRKTMFVNFQHPGEGGTTANPTAVSDWPDRGPRPRSATIVITRDDGGEIGGL